MANVTTTLDQGFATDEALSAATLRDALAIRETQWRDRGAWLGQCSRFDRTRAHAAWMDGNTEVLAHWGQQARGGLTDDAAVMDAPNPARQTA